MQVEVLKFLIEASEQLNEMRRHDADAGDEAIDLQAVERVLPDCDWFEIREEPGVASGHADESWGRSEAALEF